MRVAFKMKLHPGKEEEYKQRHDELWPELKNLLTEADISEYSIFYDAETNILFGTMNVTSETKMKELPTHPIMSKWWAYMSDIMETNTDHSPVSIPLKEVFYLK